MAINEESRHELYSKLEEVLGPHEAATLMEHLPPVGWADVATKRDLDVLATELRGEMRDLRTELRGDMAEMRGEMHALRGSFELRLADWSRTIIYTNLAAVVAVAGLAFAAAHL